MDNDDRSRGNLPPSDEDDGWTSVTTKKSKRKVPSQPQNNVNPVSTNTGAPGASSSQRSNSNNPTTRPPEVPLQHATNRNPERSSVPGSGAPSQQAPNLNRSNLPPNRAPPNTSHSSAPRPATQGFASSSSTPNDGVNLICNHFEVQFRQGKDWPTIYRYRISITSGRNAPAGAPDAQDRSEVQSKGLRRKLFKKLSEGKPELNRCAFDGASELYSTRRLSNTLEGPNAVLLPRNVNPDYRHPRNVGEALREDERVYVVTFEQSNPIEVRRFPSENAARLGDPGPTDKIILQALMIFWLDSSLNSAGDEQSVLRVGSNYYAKPEQAHRRIIENVVIWEGFHSSLRLTYATPTDQVPRLVVNHSDVMTPVLVSKPVQDFIIEFIRTNYDTPFAPVVLTRNQEARNKVSAALSGVRVQMKCGKYLREYTIRDLTSQTSISYSFPVEELQQNGQIEEEMLSVEDYFLSKHKYRLQRPEWPLLCMKGRGNSPVYIPIEVCTIMERQRYMRLSADQRTNILFLGKVTPTTKQNKIQKDLAVKATTCEALDNPLGHSFGIRIERTMITVQGRVLAPPNLYFENLRVERVTARWNYNNKGVLTPIKLRTSEWAVYQFNELRGDRAIEAEKLSERLKESFISMGIMDKHGNLKPSYRLENVHDAEKNPAERVLCMLNLFRELRLIVAILPSKSQDLYVALKKISETTRNRTVITQCVMKAHCKFIEIDSNVNNRHPGNTRQQAKDPLISLATNLALKINLKLGGTNSEVELKEILGIQPTCIFGIDVSHGSTQDAGKPSIAAVVASVEAKRWSRYAPQVRTQNANQERVEDLQVMVRDLLEEFRRNNGKYPKQIVVYRDGVSESQFETVGTDELGDFKAVCERLNLAVSVTFIIVQKRHHTRFFKPIAGTLDNMDPGTLVTSKVCQTQNQDFYLCSHKSFITAQGNKNAPGVTSRPAHYMILRDEINLGQEKIYNLTNYLCYCFGRATTAVSIPAPVYYAHVAAKHYSSLVDRDAAGGGPGLIHINNDLKTKAFRMFYV